MRILICGAGAMGCLFGGYLSLASHEVWLLSHWTEHLRRIRQQGLLLHPLPVGSPALRVPVTTLSYEEPPPEGVDISFISVKSHQTAEAAERAARSLSEKGVAITMQNGLGNLEKLARAVGEPRALQGVTSHGATLLGPGKVRHAGTGPTHIAASPDREAAERIAALLTQAGFASQVEEEIEAVIWGKLLVNVGINALTALLGVPNGILAEQPTTRALVDVAVQEAVLVARAKGISVPPDPTERALAVAQATANNISSMLADVRRQVPTEIEVMNGAIVREGIVLGIRTPVNETLTRLVKALEGTYEQRVTAEQRLPHTTL